RQKPKPARTLVASLQIFCSCAPPTKSATRELYAGAAPHLSLRRAMSTVRRSYPHWSRLRRTDRARAQPRDTVDVLIGVHGGASRVRNASPCTRDINGVARLVRAPQQAIQ